MPKEYDVKHADLDLPATASIEEIKRQYRKLALQYHPDRNAGKEVEYIPKFQAIQAAHEILGDSAKKILYDADRRKQGMFGAASTAGPTPRGHPYQAASNFPPPPRRTQPGEYKRPNSSQPRTQANGANRFSGFTAGPQPPPRPDSSQDRTNMFKAWQNMNNAQDRQQSRNTATGSGPSTPTAQNPRRPQPPPRNDTKFPTDEATRPGPSRPFDADGADGRRSAWEALNRGAQPGVQRSNTTRTPRKQGFDPNAPGSDERPASGSYYVHRHKSEDFGQPSSKASPDMHRSPNNHRRPNIDPTRPYRPVPEGSDDAPYSEANRKRTPYSSFIGEKTDFSSNLRRSKSTRDATNMSGHTSSFRPHSTSPQSNVGTAGRGTKGASFDFPSTDSENGSTSSGSSNSNVNSAFSRKPDFHRPPNERPKKVPSPPSRRFGRPGEGSSGDEPPPAENMYVTPHQSTTLSPNTTKFDAGQWRKNVWGTSSTDVLHAASRSALPAWAVPDCLTVTPKKGARTPRTSDGDRARPCAPERFLEQHHCANKHSMAGKDWRSQNPIVQPHSSLFGSLPARSSTGHARTFPEAPTPEHVVEAASHEYLSRLLNPVLTLSSCDRFRFNNGAAPFSPPHMPSGKSRSEENINMTFSEQWNGTFEGTADGTPRPTTNRKSTYSRQNSGKSRSTFGQPSPLGVNAFGQGPIPPPPPPPAPAPARADDSTTAKEHHEPASDGWTFPPPPPLKTNAYFPSQATHLSPNDISPKNARRGDSKAEDPTTSTVDPDEMDIDDSSPPGDAAAMPPPPKPVRMVSVPQSQWRQQHAANVHHTRAASSGQPQPANTLKMKTKLDDLSFVEPLARPSDAGLKDLSDLSMNLPFKSQAANILPFQTTSPQALDLPSVPVPPVPPQNLSKANWHSYAKGFSLYLHHFHTFNAQVLRHLTARELLAERKMSQGMAWLEAAGDVSGDSGANGPAGFAAYAREVQEDIRVREAWSVGCDRHVQAVKTFDDVREKVRRLANGGGLA